MPWIWSNPDPNNFTAAAAPMPHLDAPNIGALVGAILRYREASQEEANKEQQQMIANISKGISGIYGGIENKQQQGITDDTARAAEYFQQNPEAYSDYVQSGQIPAGITQGSDLNDVGLMKLMDNYRKAQGTGNDPHIIELANGQKVLVSKGGGVHPLNGGGFDNSDQILKAAKSIVDDYTKSTGITPDILESKTAVHSVPDTGLFGSKFGAGAPIPSDKYRVDLPESNKEDAHSEDVSKADFDRAHAALEQYKSILNSRLNGQTTGASTYVPGMGGIEGGVLDAQGNRAIPFQDVLSGRSQFATGAVKPGDPRYGSMQMVEIAPGINIPVMLTDKGPGVKNVDIASSNPAHATNSPFDSSKITPASALKPGTTRVVGGVTYTWDGKGWLPAE